MRVFTNKGIVQKTIIAIVIVILMTFCVPGVVHADLGGKLMSPITNFVALIFDGIQHMLERTMLGEYNTYMKDIDSDEYETQASSDASIETDEFIDAVFFGLNKVNIPVIQYTPEAIFSNQVPALDVNFINPSIKTGNDERDEKMNIAMKLRPTIASWYVALRSIAVVGLLSVLVYLGIRMLLTSIAADRAKYKQMIVDWVVAICLVLILHYIMSFALTMAETVTAMISSETDGTFTVNASKVEAHLGSKESISFAANLMSYVRFMVQAGDLTVKVAFLVLYIMLVIFSIRFTWVYLKRVVNMAFLTLIAPMVALTYPIDKVSDGKAQAFNMWLKEYTYNALIQPVDLLLYKVLLGTSVELAADNPLYAIVALGFIIAAEKLVKSMFGFNKASGGTVGSLAGAAGVTAVASNMLKGAAKKGPGPQGKVRTKEGLERQGRDADSNKPFNAFKGKDANDVIGAGGEAPAPTTSGEGGGTPSPDGEGLPPPDEGGLPVEGNDNNIGQDSELSIDDQLAEEKAGMTAQDYRESGMSPQEWEENRREELEEQRRQKAEEQARQEALDRRGYDNPFDYNGPLDKNVFDLIKDDIGNIPKFRDGMGRYIGRSTEKQENRERLKRNIKNKVGDGVRRAAIGAYKAAPTVLYKGARGVLKTAARATLAATMGTVALGIGATTGDGEKAISMALGGAAIGGTTGGNLFEATAGQKMRDKSIRDAYDTGRYGNAIDARNARADKRYFQSEKFDNFYEKYYKGKKDESTGRNYTKKDVQKFVQDYRKAGITDHKQIRRARALEDKYVKESKGRLSREDARAQVQNIAQSFGDMDIDKKAYTDPKMRAAEINRIAGMLGDPKSANNQQMAKQLFQGFADWRNSAV